MPPIAAAEHPDPAWIGRIGAWWSTVEPFPVPRAAGSFADRRVGRLSGDIAGMAPDAPG
jgi:hypothetical protein